MKMALLSKLSQRVNLTAQNAHINHLLQIYHHQ